MVEPQIFEGAFDGQRTAKADPAEHAEFGAPLQQQPHDFQKILIPTNRDAILGDSAEARHHPIVKRLVNFFYFFDWPKRRAPAVGVDT